MKKIVKILITLAVLVGLAGAGFAYLWYVWVPQEMAKREAENKFTPTPPPTLLAKDDYKIETRTDGTYIVIDKVGLTAKIPEGWQVDIQKTPDIPPEYWIKLSSPNTTTTRDGFVIDGCVLSIAAGVEVENNQDVNAQIQTIKNLDSQKSDLFREKYDYEITKIGNRETIRWVSSEFPIMGQLTGIDVPIDNDKLINIDISLPPKSKVQCLTAWEEFLKSVTIK